MQEVENSILYDLRELGDVLSRTEFLLRCGKLYKGIPEAERRDSERIRDCQTMTWLHIEWRGDKLFMRADSHSLIVKGALSLIDEMFNGRNRTEVSAFRCGLMESAEFREMFPSGQRKGLASIIKELSKSPA